MDESFYIARTLRKFNCRNNIIVIEIQSKNDCIDYAAHNHLENFTYRNKDGMSSVNAPESCVWRISYLHKTSNLPHFVLYPFDFTRKDGRSYNRSIEAYQRETWSLFNSSPTLIVIQHMRIIYDLLYEVILYGHSHENSRALSLIQNSLVNFMTSQCLKRLKKNVDEIRDCILEHQQKTIALNHLVSVCHPLSFCRAVVILLNQKYDISFCKNDADIYYMIANCIDDSWCAMKLDAILQTLNDKPFFTHDAYTSKEVFRKELLDYINISKRRDFVFMFYIYYFSDKMHKIFKPGVTQMYDTITRMIKISQTKKIEYLLSMMNLNAKRDFLIEKSCQKFMLNMPILCEKSFYEHYFEKKRNEYDIFDRKLCLDSNEYCGTSQTFSST